VSEPGAFPVAPSWSRRLAELGELDEARAVTGRLRELAQEQEHPWARAGADRCEALILLGRGELRRGGGRPRCAGADAYEALASASTQPARCLPSAARSVVSNSGGWRAPRSSGRGDV